MSIFSISCTILSICNDHLYNILNIQCIFKLLFDGLIVTQITEQHQHRLIEWIVHLSWPWCRELDMIYSGMFGLQETMDILIDLPVQWSESDDCNYLTLLVETVSDQWVNGILVYVLVYESIDTTVRTVWAQSGGRQCQIDKKCHGSIDKDRCFCGCCVPSERKQERCW